MGRVFSDPLPSCSFWPIELRGKLRARSKIPRKFGIGQRKGLETGIILLQEDVKKAAVHYRVYEAIGIVMAASLRSSPLVIGLLLTKLHLRNLTAIMGETACLLKLTLSRLARPPIE